MVLWTCNDPLPQKQSESFWPTSHLWLFPTGVVWSAGLGETAAGAAWRRLSASWSRPGSPPASNWDADFLSLPCPFSVLPFHKEYDSTCFSIRLKKKKVIKKKSTSISGSFKTSTCVLQNFWPGQFNWRASLEWEWYESSAIRFNSRDSEGDMIKQCSGQYKRNLFCLVIVSRFNLMVMQV